MKKLNKKIPQKTAVFLKILLPLLVLLMFVSCSQKSVKQLDYLKDIVILSNKNDAALLEQVSKINSYSHLNADREALISTCVAAIDIFIETHKSAAELLSVKTEGAQINKKSIENYAKDVYRNTLSAASLCCELLGAARLLPNYGDYVFNSVSNYAYNDSVKRKINPLVLNLVTANADYAMVKDFFENFLPGIDEFDLEGFT